MQGIKVNFYTRYPSTMKGLQAWANGIGLVADIDELREERHFGQADKACRYSLTLSGFEAGNKAELFDELEAEAELNGFKWMNGTEAYYTQEEIATDADIEREASGKAA